MFRSISFVIIIFSCYFSVRTFFIYFNRRHLIFVAVKMFIWVKVESEDDSRAIRFTVGTDNPGQ
jgi:hypothetical protein